MLSWFEQILKLSCSFSRLSFTNSFCLPLFDRHAKMKFVKTLKNIVCIVCVASNFPVVLTSSLHQMQLRNTLISKVYDNLLIFPVFNASSSIYSSTSYLFWFYSTPMLLDILLAMLESSLNSLQAFTRIKKNRPFWTSPISSQYFQSQIHFLNSRIIFSRQLIQTSWSKYHGCNDSIYHPSLLYIIVHCPL